MSDAFYGQQGQTVPSDEHNLLDFHIRQVLNGARTHMPVQIIAFHPGSGSNSQGTVDVQPMINQVDGQGNQTPHGIIYGIPTLRTQSGGAAIIMDPSVGDIGLMSISDRDMSALKANNGAQSNPGSMRTHDAADGIYTGSILNKTAVNKFIKLSGSGITMGDEFGNAASSGSAGWNFNGMTVDSSGNMHTPGRITSGAGGGDSVTVQHHTHDGGPPPDPGT